MKTNLRLVSLILLLAFASDRAWAQIPVTDVANLTNNTVLHAENLAKWVESIEQLRTQIDQLNRQINIQGDIRKWTGNPVEAAGNVVLDVLGQDDLVATYGKAKRAILGTVSSLDSLKNTVDGNYRAISDTDIDGHEFKRDPLTFRRYSVLDALRANTAEVTVKTKAREEELQSEIALTLDEMRSAPTDAEVQKLGAKLNALNGQLARVEAGRRREVDEVALQKIENDARIEQERLAAAELAARNDYLANQRVTSYMKTLKLRRNSHENP